MQNSTPSQHNYPGRYWRWLQDGQIQCDLCPRQCHLQEGQRGMCFVRKRENDQMVLTSYGRSSGFCVDPIEKKPLNHFLPGTPVLSFGTAGCNLACKFCQNWSISKSKEMDSLADQAYPERLAQAALQTGSRSIAYTYNDPVIFLEYAVDTAIACHQVGVKNVAVSAGYICPEARREFFRYLDAANIDLKAFSDRFYYKLTGSRLAPVLDTLQWLKHESDTWLEVTTLLIPGENDADDEIEAMSRWLADNLGSDVPLHFTAFHPDYKMQDNCPTSLDHLLRAHHIAKSNGLKYVYTGNVSHPATDNTYCHSCGETVIGRDRYQLTNWQLDRYGRCQRCSAVCAGVFEHEPGQWGAVRVPVRIEEGR